MRPLILLLGVTAPALAGPMFFAGEYTGGKFKADAALQGPAFHVRYSETAVEVADGTAVARTEERVAAVKPGVATVGVIPLPPGLEAHQVAVSVDGRAVEGRFLGAAEAGKLYGAIAEGVGSGRLLSLVGRPAYLLPRVKLGKRNDVVVELRQALSTESGLRGLQLPMPAAEFTASPVRRVRVALNLREALPVRAVFSPSHEVEVERPDLRSATVRVSMERLSHGDPLRLFWAADADDLGLRVLTHRGEQEDVGYFMLLGNPTGSAEPTAPVEKDVVLVVDTSGSMRGEKMEQVRSAVEYVLEHLNEGDRFNIVAFGTEVTPFRKEVTANTAAVRAEAQTFVEDLVAHGRTNISGALATGLAGEPSDRPRIMLFLTDGTPTAGERDPKRVVSSLAGLNTSGTQVFVFGVGHDVNAHLLDQIAGQTKGTSAYVDPDEEIDVKVASLYDSLSNPVLTNVSMAYGGLQVENVYPPQLPALFRGKEVMLLGRYRGAGEHTFTLSGTLRGEARHYEVAADFPKSAQPRNDFVALLWASRRIGELLKEIRLAGGDADKVGEVVELSRRFGILTEYTEFISGDDRDYSFDEARDMATANVEAARSQQAGRWAVRQSANESVLRTKKVSSAAFNTYRDRKGNTKKAAKLKSIGRRAFYKKGGKWVEAADGKDRKKRRIKRFSREYMDLVEQNPDFARAQSLDGDMLINVGAEQVEVY